VYERGPHGKSVPKKHRYTELATGLNYKDASGNWVPSQESIEPTAGGAVARQGQHKVIFANNLNTSGAIDLQTPDGKHLRSNILGLEYYDTATGSGVLIAQVQDSNGELISSNQVLYPNAFSGVNASVRYTYKQSSFEQDVLLDSQPPTPESLGLNPETTELVAITEFLNPPEARVKLRKKSADGLEADENIGWGTMDLGLGRAFELGGTNSPVAVVKQYGLIQGRTILLEKVPVKSIQEQLKALPLQTAVKGKAAKLYASKVVPLPDRPLAKADRKPMMLAKTQQSGKSFVLDYITVNSTMANMTFQADTTYYLSGSGGVSGTVTFEGGTVIKYAVGAELVFSTAPSFPNWVTGAYRPVILTAVDDDTVGEIINVSTGTPTGYYATVALNFGAGVNPVVSNVRISYAGQAASAFSQTVTFYNLELINCEYGVGLPGATANFYNVLFENVGNCFYNCTRDTINVENGTFYNNPSLIEYLGDGINFNAVNCIFAGGTSDYVYAPYTPYDTFSGNNNGFYNSAYTPFGSSQVPITQNPFQSVGGGNCYLASGSSCIGAGTANLDPGLLAALRQKTTTPPTIYPGNISVATTLSALVPRDTSATPNLGYHYDPLDYLFGGVVLSANLTLNNGVAIGMFESFESSGSQSVYTSGQPYTLVLNDGASLNISGTATSPVWLTQYRTVQEGVDPSDQQGWLSNVVLNGSGTGVNPVINGNFARFSTLAGMNGNFQDNWANGTATFNNSEFYSGNIATYLPSLFFTNCLFFRTYTALWDQLDAASFASINCTYYNGCLALERFAWQSASFWNLENNAFDGTAFVTEDSQVGASGSTVMDYNAYNSANLSGQTFNSGYPSLQTSTLESIAAWTHNLQVNGFTWQSSYLGGFYQPSAQLVDAGSGSAANLGLYHFTTQTSQVKEAGTVVDIGYHYVATDSNGNPIDTNGDGIPDYLEDANGDGVYDAGDINYWDNTDSNGNGLPNWWQIQYFGHLGVSPLADPDADGWNNLQEYQNGTNPNVADQPFLVNITVPTSKTAVP
jgi:hypothetical protein